VSQRSPKRRIARFFTNRFANPLVRPLVRRGLFAKETSLLETIGRKSGQPRQTPVGNGLRGEHFWIVTEHGYGSAYVKNIQANPRVRVNVRGEWRSGTAHILPDEDPYERMRLLRRHMNDTVVRAMGTEHLVIRVDLD
jgi:deazaflavin-dependent oxidoreductase (nitroreductase family)